MSTPREKAVFCEALEITDPAQRRHFLDQGLILKLICGIVRLLLQEAQGLIPQGLPAQPGAAP